MVHEKKIIESSDLYINPKEVQELLGVKVSKSYRIIQELNKELQEMGYMTVRGKVSRKYFLKRFGLESETRHE